MPPASQPLWCPPPPPQRTNRRPRREEGVAREFGPIGNEFRTKRRDPRAQEKDPEKGAWPGTRGKVVRVGGCSPSGIPPTFSELSPASSIYPFPQPPAVSSTLQVAMPVPPASSCVCLPISCPVPRPVTMPLTFPSTRFPCKSLRPLQAPCALLTPLPRSPLPLPVRVPRPLQARVPVFLLTIGSCAYGLPESPGTPCLGPRSSSYPCPHVRSRPAERHTEQQR